ncbi:hypothetical protein PSM7751_01438 [Pseudooceanicola marinus]|uniref:Uncharacterized protein n=1 Tax=Pseudooceanicola marinus TaxID=396013 RepID=A0A1X6YXR2_9RHOB|nr:hypothetical protein [Pseudooceanicola marinus]PJE32644.1 hypothetical protein CVM50_07040 [Pseudooceanicola marinus]SLN34745.1 hypothetical protein PSM7751_01438 [Pseudooceanicola marinus]
MDVMIWGGAAVSLVGLVLLVWSIIKVARGRSAGLEDAELREVIRRAMPMNMGGLLLSVFGLMLVILGIWLG